MRTLAVALVLLWASPALADGIFSEPWVRWRSEHFTVHTHESAAEVGAGAAQLVEGAYQSVAPVFGWPVTRTHIVVEDRTDGFNGFANVVPWNAIRLNAVPPTSDSVLGYFDNWLWNLLVHEYVHIVHISRVTGLPGAANRVLDTEFAPNQAVPRWFTEGLATWFESDITGTGRLNSAFFDAWWRGPALDGAFPDLGDLSGSPLEWPHATGWYLYGAHFVRYLVERHGIDALVRFADIYGRQVVPFRVNEVARKAFGTGFVDEWPGFRASMEGRAWAEQVSARARGGRRGVAVSEGANATRYVAVHPDGRLAWLSDDGQRQASIVIGEDPATRRNVLVDGAGEFDFIDATTAVIGQAHTVARFFAFRDLYAVDLTTGEERPLTWGARAREPRVSPDRAMVAFVSPRDGRTELRLLDLASGDVRTVFEAEPWAQASSPAWTDDGRIVFAYQRPGHGRDLYVVDPADGVPGRLTHDAASATDPWFVPCPADLDACAGSILFSSDRSGIHDIYALDLRTSDLRRLTSDAVGAFAPRLASDGRLVFSTIGAAGFRVVAVELGAPVWEAGAPAGPVAHPMRPRPIPLGALPSTRRGPVVAAMRGPDWTLQFGLGSFTSRVGLRLAGTDAPGVNAYALAVQWSFRFDEPVGSISYTNRRLPVSVGVTAGRNLVERATRLYAESRDVPFVEEQYAASLGFSIPFPRLTSRHDLSFGYGANWYSYLDEPDVTHSPVDMQPRDPVFLRYNALRFGWSWSDVRRFADSYTTPQGSNAGIGFRLRSPAIGAEVESAELTLSVAHYRMLPWGHHVVAMRASGGISEARGVGRREFVLGGNSPQDVFLALRDGLPASSGTIRGYAPGVRQGNQYYRGQVEYRFPLVDIGAGSGTLPAYVQRLHGAFFLDTGLATSDRVSAEDALYGVGGELRLSSIIGYTEGAAFRAGAARGFGPDGAWDIYLLYGFEY